MVLGLDGSGSCEKARSVAVVLGRWLKEGDIDMEHAAIPSRMPPKAQVLESLLIVACSSARLAGWKVLSCLK